MEVGEYFASIPGFEGVWASESTVEAWRTELRNVLEDWLLVKLLYKDPDIPVIGKLDLVPGQARKTTARHAPERSLAMRARKVS